MQFDLRIEKWTGKNGGSYIVMTNTDNGAHLTFSVLNWLQIKQTIDKLTQPKLH